MTARCRGDDGSSMVTAVAIMFAATFLALVWLAGDVDRARSNESTAAAIAFQSARSGAQAASVGALRAGEVTIDTDAASIAASRTAQRLFDSYEVDGRIAGIDVDVPGRRVRVDVTITDGSITVHGSGVVTVREGP